MAELPDVPRAEALIVERTNAFRASEGLPPVVRNLALERAAQLYAKYLAKSGRFAHEADGRQPSDRTRAAGYWHCMVAENLASFLDSRGFKTRDLANQMVEGWKSSPGHRKNLLMEHATETGVAIVKASREEKYFAVQLFARPSTLSFTFEVVNAASKPLTYAVGGREARIEPRIVRQHTECEPASLTFQLAPAGLVSKPVTVRHEAKPGHVYRLVADKAGKVTVEARPK